MFSVFLDLKFMACFCFFKDAMYPPRNVRGYAISSEAINVTWEKPPDLNGEIFYNTHLTDWITRVDPFGSVTKETFLVVRNLKAFRDYLVRVEVYTHFGKRGAYAFFIKTLEDGELFVILEQGREDQIRIKRRSD